MTPLQPIFVHSLFRAGSTYIFNCFRRVENRYWCYQEPLNEFLCNATFHPKKLVSLHEQNAKHLRHPAIEKPYFYEFHEIARQVAEKFNSNFSYEDYFSQSEDASKLLAEYFKVLIAEAKGRPVFQECRSCGRVEIIRRYLGGQHIFLWRNPWDQWWSYKVDSHFDICNLQILASSSAPPLFVELRQILNFCPRNSNVENVQGQRLDARNSYFLFFALWCHSMLEARLKCDYEINIDSLSLNKSYREHLVAKLEANLITGIDFSDCAVFIGVYGPEDRVFFQDIEEQVYELLASHGYDVGVISEMVASRAQHDCHKTKPSVVEVAFVKEADKSHKTTRRLESELSMSQRQLSGIKEFLKIQEANLQQRGLQLQELNQELSRLKNSHLFAVYRIFLQVEENLKKHFTRNVNKDAK